MKEGTSIFENGLIWFGAGVSIAEILTGTLFAPLGIQKGLLAIVIGHIIGCIMLYMAGIIGAKTKQSSMEITKRSFGNIGGKFFALLNILQLVGWTGIMIYDGSLALNSIFNVGEWLWCLVIGGLIIIWILIGIKNLGKINMVSMTLLFVLTLLLCKVIFLSNHTVSQSNSSISFFAAVELAVAMPLSWLPLISDYTKEAREPFQATLVSVLVYSLISSWMYFIGMSATIFTSEVNVATIMLKAGLGIVALLIVVLSTVTTTFLDAFSAGISCKTIDIKINEKTASIVITIIGMLSAIIYPMDNITNFLYLIGSVFAPMIAIMICDYFILKQDSSNHKIDIGKLVVWFIGFLIYRYIMNYDMILGNTFVDMIITIMICIIYSKFMEMKESK